MNSEPYRYRYSTDGFITHNARVQGKSQISTLSQAPVPYRLDLRRNHEAVPVVFHSELKKPKNSKRKKIITSGSILALVTITELSPYLLQRLYLVALIYLGLVILLRVNSRQTMHYALLFLILTPVLHVIKLQSLAVVYASLGYLFLVIGVMTAFFEMKFIKGNNTVSER